MTMIDGVNPSHGQPVVATFSEGEGLLPRYQNERDWAIAANVDPSVGEEHDSGRLARELQEIEEENDRAMAARLAAVHAQFRREEDAMIARGKGMPLARAALQQAARRSRTKAYPPVDKSKISTWVEQGDLMAAATADMAHYSKEPADSQAAYYYGQVAQQRRAAEDL